MNRPETMITTVLNVNVHPYIETSTDSLLNLSWKKPKSFDPYSPVMEYYKDIRAVGYMLDSRTLFRSTFGPQLCCRDYSHRNWIWTFSDITDSAVLYALLNVEGVAWEYNCKQSDPKALENVLTSVIGKLVECARSLAE